MFAICFRHKRQSLGSIFVNYTRFNIYAAVTTGKGAMQIYLHHYLVLMANIQTIQRSLGSSINWYDIYWTIEPVAECCWERT